MKSESTAKAFVFPSSTSSRDVLTDILRDGAQRLLTHAIEAEVAEFIDSRSHLRTAHGHRAVVRNGYLPARNLVTGVGPIEVRQPRVRDRRPPHETDEADRFSSKILPPYLRKTKAIEELIPWLYLKGISTNDFPEALAALVGVDAGGLSASTITRLVESWQIEHQAWSTRSLEGKQYVYLWADGVHFNIRLQEDRQCMLVLMGATPEGRKELIAIADGHRESAESWKELLLDVKSRGMSWGGEPKLATGDGALGFWKALPQVYPTTRTQRCWVHKMANVLDKLPRRVQPQAKRMLHDIWMAETRADANRAFDLFLDTYRVKHAAATACLEKDREALLAFYDFPAEHWMHIRTTNPIESVFATVRLRTDKTKGSGSRIACLTMVFKLMESASKRWRALNGTALIPDVIAGIQFTDGIKSQKIAA